MDDRYEDMKGPELSEELARRELPVSGKVDELRARLRGDDERRAQAGADESEEPVEGEDTEADDIEVPEPREPLRIQPYGVNLTEEQARALNQGEARIRQFMKHVNPISELKYAAGDQVMALGSPDSTTVRVLPYGVEIELSPAPAPTDGED